MNQSTLHFLNVFTKRTDIQESFLHESHLSGYAAWFWFTKKLFVSESGLHWSQLFGSGSLKTTIKSYLLVNQEYTGPAQLYFSYSLNITVS